MNFLGERLKRARKASGFSLRQAADLVGVSQTMIKKYEDGSFPSSDVLLRLAKAYNVRMEYFFRSHNTELEGVQFRKRNKLGKKKLAAIEHMILDQVERRLEIEDLCPNRLIQTFSIPKGVPDKIETLEQIEEVAQQLRKAWKLGLAPVTNLVDLLEEHVIRVFMVDIDDKSFDGLAGTVDDVPIVVVGASWPGDRQRFTLAHELGHLLIEGRLNKGFDEERAVNRFAGAFLWPKEVVFQELGRSRKSLELRECLLIKEEYGLSMCAQCYRLKDLGIISESYFKQLMKRFNKRGWKKQEPGKPYPSERVHVFEHLVLYAFSEDVIGESKAAELLNMTIEEFRNYRMINCEKSLAC